MPSLVRSIGKIAFSAKSKEMPQKIGKILFLKTGALGDVLMTTPLVLAIRHRFPAATIDYACGKSFSGALKGNRNINYVIEFDEKIFFTRNIKELKKLATRLKENKYDVIFVLDKHWAASVFASMAGNFRIGFDRNGDGFANNLNVFYKQNKHDIQSYLDLGLYFRAKPQGTKMNLPISEKDRKFAKRACPKNAVGIAPGGGVNTGQKADVKLWPKERYVQLIDALAKKYSIVLVGGKKDNRICSWIRAHAKNKKRIKNTCGKTTFGQTGATLELCKFIVCNDSGAMHIASCVNDRVISLFGPTNPHVLAPLNNGSIFIWKENEACYDIYGNFGKCKNDMMKKISVEDVLNAASKCKK